jgi:hypothetical protein
MNHCARKGLVVESEGYRQRRIATRSEWHRFRLTMGEALVVRVQGRAADGGASPATKGYGLAGQAICTCRCCVTRSRR